MKSLFYLASTLLLTFSAAQQEGTAQTPEGDKYDCRPVQDRCPTSTTLTAADYLIEDWRLALNANNLVRIQAVKAPGATFRMVLRDDLAEICTNTGEQELLEGLIPVLGDLFFATAYTIESKYVDTKGRLLVFTSNFNSADHFLKSRFVFVPIPGTCDYRLSEFSILDDLC